MPYISGNAVVDQHTVLDLNDQPLTGLTSPADVTLTLLRSSGSTVIAASETVSFAEIGSTGRYYFSFSPQNSGRYILEVNETNASSGQRRVKYTYDVLSAGTAFLPSYANAFCSQADITRWLQQPISSSTKPSDTEASAFAETRASTLMSLCAGLGFPVAPATVVSGSRLQDLLRDADAIGAALDYTIAQSFATTPSKTERAPWLDQLWLDYTGLGNAKTPGMVKGGPGLIEREIRGNLSALASNHILSGDTQGPTVTTTPVDVGIQITLGQAF